MDLSSTVGAKPTDTPSVNAVATELLSGMDAEQASIIIGLGLLVQRAAEVEYVLHGIYAHLGNKEFPYADEPQGSVTNVYIKKSLTRLGSIPSEQIPPEDRQALIHDLELCKESFAQRNLFIHGCWTFDDEVQAWRVVKGQKPDSVVFDLVYSEDVLGVLSHEVGAASEPFLNPGQARVGSLIPGQPWMKPLASAPDLFGGLRVVPGGGGGHHCHGARRPSPLAHRGPIWLTYRTTSTWPLSSTRSPSAALRPRSGGPARTILAPPPLGSTASFSGTPASRTPTTGRTACT